MCVIRYLTLLLFLPILLYRAWIWGAYDNMNIKKWGKDPWERLHTQFNKYFHCLNRNNYILDTSWISFRKQFAKQCSIISSQLANETKTSFMLTVNEIMDIQNQWYNKTIQTNNTPIIKHNLQKIKYHISNNLKRHQLVLISSDKKLCFYPIFQTDVRKSHYLEQVKNLKHRRAAAKLWSGNHSVRI